MFRHVTHIVPETRGKDQRVQFFEVPQLGEIEPDRRWCQRSAVDGQGLQCGKSTLQYWRDGRRHRLGQGLQCQASLFDARWRNPTATPAAIRALIGDQPRLATSP